MITSMAEAMAKSGDNNRSQSNKTKDCDHTAAAVWLRVKGIYKETQGVLVAVTQLNVMRRATRAVSTN